MSENKPVEKTAIADTRFNLSSTVPTGSEERPSTFSPSFFNNKPGFSVFGNGPNASNVFFNLDITTVHEFLEMLKQSARSKERVQYRWQVTGYPKGGTKQEMLGTLICGKSEDGTVYIGVRGAHSQNTLKFDFKPHFSFMRVDQDGNPVPANEVSGGIAVGWATALEKTLSQLHARDYKHPEPRSNNNRGNWNGNRGGNGGWKGNNNNGGNRGNWNNNNNGGGNGNWNNNQSNNNGGGFNPDSSPMNIDDLI